MEITIERNGKLYWPVSRLAKASGLSAHRIRQLIADGEIEAERIDDPTVRTRWLIPADEARRFLAERG